MYDSVGINDYTLKPKLRL